VYGDQPVVFLGKPTVVMRAADGPGTGRFSMKLAVVVQVAEEGSYWAEVPAIPGCATQGESFEELLTNLYEAVEGCLSVDVGGTQPTEKSRIIEIAV
jgi:predicted RNase H-like HicB family nuclease